MKKTILATILLWLLSSAAFAFPPTMPSSGSGQPVDDDLTAIAALSVAQGKFLIGNATPAWSLSGYTLPTSVCTNGYILQSNGTNMVCVNSLTGVTLGGFTENKAVFGSTGGALASDANVRVSSSVWTWSDGYIAAPVSAPEVFIDCNGSTDPYAYCTGANASTLTARLVTRTIINSYGRGEAQTVTLPTAAAGMTFIAIVGTQHNSAWKIQRGGSDTIIYDGTASKTYFQETNQAVGSRVSCFTFKTGAAAWTWVCGGSSGTWVTD